MVNTFIIHVSKGYEARKLHIDTHLPKRGLTDYEFILKGDISDLIEPMPIQFNKSVLSPAQMSCFYKHYLALKIMMARNLPQVLVLEDDAILVPDFKRRLSGVLSELEGKTFYYANIEDAASAVPLSVRQKGQVLYPCKVNKLAGGYICDLAFAKAFIQHAESHQIDAPIDGYFGNVRERLDFTLFWLEPPMVRQGSKTGMFASELSGGKQGICAAMKGWLKDSYRRYVRSNLSANHKELFDLPKKN